MRGMPLMLLGGLMACAGESGTSSLKAGPPAAVTVVVGDSQAGTVHAALAAGIRVRVSDAQGRTVPDQLVNFVVTKGGGSAFAGASLTDASGEATDFWTLGDTAGVQELEARAIENGLPVVLAKVTAIASPGPLASAGFTQASLVVSLDTVIALPATAEDAYGNPLPLPPILGGAPIGTISGGTLSVSDLGLATLVLGTDSLRVVSRWAVATFVVRYTFGGVRFEERGTLRPVPSTGWCALNPDAVMYDASPWSSTRSDTTATWSAAEIPGYLCLTVGTPNHPLTASYQFAGTGISGVLVHMDRLQDAGARVRSFTTLASPSYADTLTIAH